MLCNLNFQSLEKKDKKIKFKLIDVKKYILLRIGRQTNYQQKSNKLITICLKCKQQHKNCQKLRNLETMTLGELGKDIK